VRRYGKYNVGTDRQLGNGGTHSHSEEQYHKKTAGQLFEAQNRFSDKIISGGKEKKSLVTRDRDGRIALE